MRTILKIASDYAKFEELMFTFDVEHVQKALEMVSISKAYERSVIYAVFNYEHNTPLSLLELFKKDDINSFLEKLTLFDCTDEVLQKLSLIASYGVDLTSDEIYTLYDDKFPLDYEEGTILKKNFVSNNIEEVLSVNSLNEMLKESVSGFKRLNRIKRLKNILNENILSQESAVEAVTDVLVKSEHIQDPKRPNGVLLFLGPSATGKTSLAQLLSENLIGYDNHKIIDMTQFLHKEEGSVLFGTTRQWGSSSTGMLTSFVKDHPKSIAVLFLV